MSEDCTDLIRVRLPSDGVSYSVESSTDLQTWSPADVRVSAPDGNNFCTATVPMTGPRRFMRLVVDR